MGRIDFRYDPVNDIVIGTPHWSLETEADVLEWYRQYSTYFEKLGRRVDFIVVLDDFSVAPAIGARWGEVRARGIKNYTRLNYRVRSSRKVRLFVNTSGVRFDVAREEADSVEEAIAAILEARKTLARG